MQTEKLIINADGKELLLGSHFHVLVDKSNSTFSTNQIPEFVKFMAAASTDAQILCRPSGIAAWPGAVDRYTKMVADCSLELSTALKGVAEIQGKPQPLAAFSDFMEKFKRFTDQAGLDLLANLRHFKLRKVVSVDSKKEQNGDFSYGVKLETAGIEDFAPPKTLVFTLPVFKYLPELEDSIRLSFELNFSFVQGETPVLNFTLTNFAYEDELLARQVEIINRHLASLPHAKLWGSQTITQLDDSWAYKPNPIPVKG